MVMVMVIVIIIIIIIMIIIIIHSNRCGFPSRQQNIPLRLDFGRTRPTRLVVQEKCAEANPTRPNERYHLEIGEEGAVPGRQETSGFVEIRWQKT